VRQFDLFPKEEAEMHSRHPFRVRLPDGSFTSGQGLWPSAGSCRAGSVVCFTSPQSGFEAPWVVAKELMKLQRFRLQFFLFALILSVFDHRLQNNQKIEKIKRKTAIGTAFHSFSVQRKDISGFFDIDIRLMKN
jgi:hypothetical protein